MNPFPNNEDDEDTPTTGRQGTCRQELDEIERLLQPDHPTARQDALQAESFVGREWLTDEVDAWLRDENATWAMLVTGSPGCGKSAFAAHELSHDGRVGAAVFCQHDGAAFDSLESVSRSVAFQLATRFPDYRTALLSVLRRETEQLEQARGLRERGPLEHYVTSVLPDLIGDGSGNVVIVIDGLDEVTREESGLNAVNPLAQELGRFLSESRVPRNIRFLITARADGAVVESFDQPVSLDIDTHLNENDGDLRAYAAARLGRESPLCEEIAENANGSFLYARVACGLANDGELEGGSVPASLGGLYRLSLDRAFKRMASSPRDAQGASSRARDALCLVASMGDSIPWETLRRAMKWSEHDEKEFREALWTCLSETPDGRVSLFQRSLSDWLRSDEAREYRCERGEGRELALEACIASFHNGVGGMNSFEATNLLPLLQENEESHLGVLLEVLGSAEFAERLLTLARDGRFSERARCLEGALSIYHSLAEGEPDGYLPVVARTSNDLGVVLFQTGRLDEAEAHLREALEIRRLLEEREPSTYLPLVAMSCNNLALPIYLSGNSTEAKALFLEALDIFRRFAEREPGTYLPCLATACNNLTIQFSPLKEDELLGEALVAYRSLAKVGPEVWLPAVASTCECLSNILDRILRCGDAKELRDEAVATYRSLAGIEPGPYLPHLARLCSDLGSRVSLDNGAEGLCREALSAFRSLEDRAPGAWLPNLARSCSDLADVLTKTGRDEEAEGLYREALVKYHSLAEGQSGTLYLWEEADACCDLAKILSKTGRDEEVGELYREALQIHRMIAEADPKHDRSGVAFACMDLAEFLSGTGRLEDAEGPFREALAGFRSLEAIEDNLWGCFVALTSMNLGTLLSNLDRLDEAEGMYRDAHGIFLSLEISDSDRFLPFLADSCGRLATFLYEREQYEEAEGLFRDELNARCKLARYEPDSYLPVVVSSFGNLIAVLSRLGRQEDAEELYLEALDICLDHRSDDPGMWDEEIDELRAARDQAAA